MLRVRSYSPIKCSFRSSAPQSGSPLSPYIIKFGLAYACFWVGLTGTATSSISVYAYTGHDKKFDRETDIRTTLTTLEVDSTSTQQMGIKIVPVFYQYFPKAIKTTGKIETSEKQVEVRNPTAGSIVELLVNPGDYVQQGVPIIVISSLELVELQVESLDRLVNAQAQLEEALANLQLAQQNLERQRQIASAEISAARTELSIAQERYERDLQLEKEGALPRRQMLESQALLAQTKSTLQKAINNREIIEAEAELKRVQAQVNAARIRLQLSDKTYQTRLQQLNTYNNERGLVTIVAPISGIVTNREVSLGESFEEAGETLMTLVDNSRVSATVNINQKDLEKVKEGQLIRVKVSRFPKQVFSGRVTHIEPIVEGATKIISIKTQIDNPQGQLKSGMIAEIEIVTDKIATPILSLPNSAIVEDKGRHLIYIQTGNNVYQPVEVSLGESFGDSVEVKQGLFEGDRVVFEGAIRLYAQSLPGNNQISHSTQHNQVSLPTKLTNHLPEWLLFSFSGAIGIGAFLLGRLTRRRIKTKENEPLKTVTDKSIV